MDPRRRHNTITIIGVSFLAMGICIFGGTMLAQYLASGASTTTSSTNSESTEPAVKTWKNAISLAIPNNITGGSETVNLNDKVPYYEDAFAESNVKYLRDKSNPYLFKLTVPSSNGENSTKYIEDLSKDNLFTYSCADYQIDTITTTYVFDYDEYRLMITPFFENYVDNLYIRYIPNGDNWPSSSLYNIFENDAYNLIPGMDLAELPTIGEAVDSCVTFSYNTSGSELSLYKQTLTYFGYRENNGLFTNTRNNSVMIDLSVENTISITAPTK